MRSILTVALLIFVFSLPASAQIYSEVAKLTESNPTPFGNFGQAVATEGDVVLVGHASGTSPVGKSGVAYIFRWDGTTWMEEQKLIASDAAVDDQFGVSVSLSGDVALVGAKIGDRGVGQSGAAYIFRRIGSSWVEEQKLTASDAFVGSLFGASVAVSGNFALVGARQVADAGFSSGAAYLYQWNGTSWNEIQKLTASDAAFGDLFGFSVFISGDVALVGANSKDSAAGSNTGAVYVFRSNGSSWVEEQKLAASDAAIGDKFGHAVSAFGNRAIVGAINGDGAVAGSGASYVFRWDGNSWFEEQKLTPSDGTVAGLFGVSVSLAEGIALIGANQANGAMGAAYLFRWDGTAWVEEQILTASDGAMGDRFGFAVSVSDFRTVVGATNNSNFGAAYIFSTCADVASLSIPVMASVLPVGGGTTPQMQQIGTISVVPGMNSVINAKFTFVPAYSYLDNTYDFRWINLVTGAKDPAGAYDTNGDGIDDYNHIGGPLDSNSNGIPEVLLKIGSETIAYEIPIIDGQPGQFTGVGTFATEDLYYNDEEDGSWDAAHTEGLESNFFDQRSQPFGTNLDFKTYLVVADIGNGVLPIKSFCPLIGFNWHYGSVPAEDASICSTTSDFSLITAGMNNSLANGLSGQPVFSQWSSESSCVLSKPLHGTPSSVSLSSGGSYNMTLNAGPSRANDIYFVTGSLSGTSPGFPIGLFDLPLNPDFYFKFLNQNPNTLIANSFGFLDANGQANAILNIPTGTSSSFAGPANHAFAILDAVTGEIKLISNAESMTLDP